MRSYFTSYYKVSEEVEEQEEEVEVEKKVMQPSFAEIRKFVDETTANSDDILNNLKAIIEEPYSTIEKFLPKIIADLINEKNWRFETGVSSFVQEVSDLESDAPDLPQWMFNLVIKPLLEAKKLDLKKINWL